MTCEDYENYWNAMEKVYLPLKFKRKMLEAVLEEAIYHGRHYGEKEDEIAVQKMADFIFNNIIEKEE